MEDATAATTEVTLLSPEEHAKLASAHVHEANNTATATATLNEPVDGPGEFEIYFRNPDNVPVDKQMPYIMMMASDVLEGEV